MLSETKEEPSPFKSFKSLDSGKVAERWFYLTTVNLKNCRITVVETTPWEQGKSRGFFFLMEEFNHKEVHFTRPADEIKYIHCNCIKKGKEAFPKLI